MMTNCPMCGREMIEGKSVDKHHMIPKSKKGTATETIHKVCHRKIHSVFSENELRNFYNNWDDINAHTEIIKFVKWVAKKDPGFYGGSKDTKSRSNNRRR